MVPSIRITRAIPQVAAVGILALSSLSTGMVVPDRMQPNAATRSTDWSASSVIPLDFSVEIQEMESMTAKAAIDQNMGDVGSIAFVVRRPG